VVDRHRLRRNANESRSTDGSVTAECGWCVGGRVPARTTPRLADDLRWDLAVWAQRVLGPTEPAAAPIPSRSRSDLRL